MQHHPFGNTGLSVSPLAIGTTHEPQVIHSLLDAGVNLIDTAQCYGEHETFLGRTVSHRRHEFILVSKCGHHDILPDGSMRSRPISMADIDTALAKLRTDHLDVMLLHSYDRDLLESGEALGVLSEAKRAGKIRFAGYSGDNETAAIAVQRDEVEVLETSISIADQRNIDLVLPLCQEHGIGVIAKRPIANAAWRYLADAREPDEHVRPYAQRLAAMNLDITRFGFKDSSADWSALALRFNLTVPGLHTSIVATANAAHAKANINAANQDPLPKATYNAIRNAFQQAEAETGNTWHGQN